MAPKCGENTWRFGEKYASAFSPQNIKELKELLVMISLFHTQSYYMYQNVENQIY
jgi:hypothetical protein